MNLGKFEGHIAVIWDSMLCVLFAAIMIQRLQELEIGMQLTWVDWVLMLLCAINLIYGAILLISPKVHFEDDSQVSNRDVLFGWIATLAIFALVLLCIAGVSNALTDVIIVLTTLALLVGTLWYIKVK